MKAFRIETFDTDDFLPGFFALEKGHGALGEAELFGEEGAKRFVGAAFEGGRVDFDFQRVAEPAGDLGARGVGQRFDC